MATKKPETPKPITTYNATTRKLRVEGDGWYIEAQVLASGRQMIIRCAGTVDGEGDMIIRPAVANAIFVSSRASEAQIAEDA